MEFFITKASGEQELFDAKKFSRSLRKAGAGPDIIEKLLKSIESLPNLRTTKDVYQYAYNYLSSVNPPVALKYSLKTALFELGPTGFPFEKYVAEIFRYQGYKAITNQIVSGSCVSHEVDVIISKDSNYDVVECKFHALPTEKITIKVALYIKARFDDIKHKQEFSNSKKKRHKKYCKNIWLVSNVQFTESVKIYARCVGIKLLGWAYPKNRGIEKIIDMFGLQPITILSKLTRKQKAFLIDSGLLLCKDIKNQRNLLLEAGVPDPLIEQIIEESELLTKV